jgi:soluble P-type ATPase
MVMGSSSPSHRLPVQCLKKKDQIAAMVGVKTNDIVPPKEADVGIVKGTRNNEMTIENSDIIISCDAPKR